MNKKGQLIVVSAPSGCGKGTILAEILKDGNYCYSVSATTRSPREGEKDGVNYHFLTKEKFKELIAGGKMLEYTEYCGNYYGTPLSFIDENLEKGKNVILEIEVAGAANVRKLCPDAVLIFILPPSMKELRHRLEKRGTESEETVNKRVNEAYNEIKHASEYDYIMVNGPIDKAVEDFRTILSALSMRKNNNLELISSLLNENI